MEEWQKEIETLEAQNKTLAEKIIDPEAGKLSLREFTNISKNAATYIKEGDPMIKDLIVRIIFANLKVDTQKVTDFTLNEPFATLLKDRVIKHGRHCTEKFEQYFKYYNIAPHAMPVRLWRRRSARRKTRGSIENYFLRALPKRYDSFRFATKYGTFASTVLVQYS